jgi:hypothetical protein
MAQPRIQPSFNSGEWSPTLYARVDLEKYHTGAALLRNFFVDYRGGASTRTGTRYLIQAYKSATAVRVIGFQASTTVSYVLEFGDQYIRFISNGTPVLEAALTITGISQHNPAVVSVVNTWHPGDVVYITGVTGMTQVNGNYYLLSATAAGNVALADLNGVAIDSTGYTAWSAGGTIARVYTLPSPYAAADLALVKFVQNVSYMILTHPSYVPQKLTLISASNWTIAPVAFGSALPAPTGISVATTLTSGTVNYAYLVTAVDTEGQESPVSVIGALASKTDLRTVAGTNTVTWNAVSGASSYNVYKSQVAYGVAVPAGTQFGYAGNCTGATFIDSNIAQDYSIGPPVSRNPFQGAGVASATVTVQGTYATVPTCVFDAAPAGGATATGVPGCQTIGTPSVGTTFTPVFTVGQAVTFPSGHVLIVATTDGAGTVTGWQPMTYPGSFSPTITSGALPSTTGIASYINVGIVWGVTSVGITSAGAGYTSVPAITFSAGSAAATAVLATASAGNPTVPQFYQQRLTLAGPPGSPQQFNMSQTGFYFNYNVSNPVQDDDAIQGQIVSGQLNTIKSMVPMPSGLITFTSSGAWLLNGGGAGTAVTPQAIVANAQSYNGASDVPPIVANFDILFVQAKGSIVRDLTYNFYANIFTGTDITVLSSHLFYGYSLNEWAWAEEPFKVVWAVRSDGTLLSLTFVKEQDFIAWAHSDTEGTFKSVCTVTESVSGVLVNAVYVVVERVVAGNTVQYIERFAERTFAAGVVDAWCVDAGLQYSGAPATTFSGGQHLSGMTCTGLADGLVITPFVMPASGNFTLAVAASKVTVGLAFTAQLQTLALDAPSGDGTTVQGKPKKINAVDVRVADTLGLKIGSDFSAAHLVTMKDLVVGNVGSMLIGQSSQLVTDLYSGDTRTYLNPTYTVPGQYCIQQDLPLPATILGVIPQFEVGDTRK